MEKSVLETRRRNLCISCGVCKNVCKRKCIKYVRDIGGGGYLPYVEKDRCINCGLCLEICPGVKVDYIELYEYLEQGYPKNIFLGNYLECFNAYANSDILRNNGVSGGVATSIIKYCILNKIFEGAFVVNATKFESQIISEYIDTVVGIEKSQKSRYLPVSHEEAVKQILLNRNKRYIIIGTSCAIQGIIKVIMKFKLNRDNYLLLGLFCDKILNYNFYDYFEDNFAKKNSIDKFYFRYKETCGWPGNVHIDFKNGKSKNISRVERIRVKDIFCPERCLYCIDKLNQFSDISLGDNYSNKKMIFMDSNSIIVRTDIGKKIINEMINSNYISVLPIEINDIYNSQKIADRVKNIKHDLILKSKTGYMVNNLTEQYNYNNSDKKNLEILINTCKKGSQLYDKNKLMLKCRRIVSKYKRKLF